MDLLTVPKKYFVVQGSLFAMFSASVKFLCPSVIITDTAPDLLTVPKNFLTRPGKQKSGREP